MNNSNPIKVLLTLDCNTGEGGRFDHTLLVEFANISVLQWHQFNDFKEIMPQLNQIIQQLGQDRLDQVPEHRRNSQFYFLPGNYEYDVNWVSDFQWEQLTPEQLNRPVAMTIQ